MSELLWTHSHWGMADYSTADCNREIILASAQKPDELKTLLEGVRQESRKDEGEEGEEIEGEGEEQGAPGDGGGH